MSENGVPHITLLYISWFNRELYHNSPGMCLHLSLNPGAFGGSNLAEIHPVDLQNIDSEYVQIFQWGEPPVKFPKSTVNFSGLLIRKSSVYKGNHQQIIRKIVVEPPVITPVG